LYRYTVAASFIAFAVLSGWHMGIIEAVCTMVGPGRTASIQLTHSFKAPGFNL
jgi:hypothetical protein